jgi:rod shape-determining protein MreB
VLKAVLYVQIRPDRFIVRNTGDGRVVDRTAASAFSHPRTLVGNFTTAEALLKELVSEAKGGFVLKTDILIHPLERVDGGLTQIEERALHELAVGSGASKVLVWVGSALTDADVIEKMRKA